jgi:hypothetical protein
MSFIRLVVSGFCLLAATAPSGIAADFTPDPALGHPDQRLHLYGIARAYCERNWDADANLVGAQSKHPPNKKQHSTRESTYYAYGLLLTGDPKDLARAQDILKRVLATQDANPQNASLYGAFGWLAEDPPGDLNSAAFVGGILAEILYLDRKKPRLDPVLRRQVEDSVRMSVAAVMHRDVDGAYTNMAILSIALAAAGDKLLSVPGAGEWAGKKLDKVLALAGDKGEFAEYLSPTYTGVAIQGASIAKRFAFSDAFAAKVDTLINRLWQQVAKSYHAPTYQLGGPQQRAYGDNMLDYAADLKYWLYLALDGAYPLPDTDNLHDWDKAAIFCDVDLPMEQRDEFKLPTVAWRQWDAVSNPPVPTRHLSQYREGNFILGTVAYQDEWKQKRNLVAYWRNDGPPPLNMNVGYCIDESNESIPGFPGEKIHWYSTQVKGIALVAMVASIDVPSRGTTCFVFNSGVVVTPGDAGAVQVQNGTITTRIYPVSKDAVSYQSEPDDAHHMFRLTRLWNSSNFVNSFHVMAYVIDFRAPDQAPPVVTDMSLTQDKVGVTASAKVDGVALSIPSMN